MTVYVKIMPSYSKIIAKSDLHDTLNPIDLQHPPSRIGCEHQSPLFNMQAVLLKWRPFLQSRWQTESQTVSIFIHFQAVTPQVNKAEIVAWVYSLQVVPDTHANGPENSELAKCDQSETGDVAPPLSSAADLSPTQAKFDSDDAQPNHAEVASGDGDSTPDMTPGELKSSQSSAQLDATCQVKQNLTIYTRFAKGVGNVSFYSSLHAMHFKRFVALFFFRSQQPIRFPWFSVDWLTILAHRCKPISTTSPDFITSSGYAQIFLCESHQH